MKGESNEEGNLVGDSRSNEFFDQGRCKRVKLGELGVAEYGKFRGVRLGKSALVVAETWPGWMCFLQGIEWTKIVILIKHKHVYKKLWLDMSSVVTMKPWSALLACYREVVEDDGWLWLQGLKEFMRGM